MVRELAEISEWGKPECTQTSEGLHSWRGLPMGASNGCSLKPTGQEESDACLDSESALDTRSHSAKSIGVYTKPTFQY